MKIFKTILFFINLFAVCVVNAQSDTLQSEIPEKESYTKVDELPRFPGCEDESDVLAKEACSKTKLMKYLFENVDYPVEARKLGKGGQTVIQFFVTQDGVIEDITIVRDPGFGLGEAAKKVIESMKKKSIKWIPGKVDGKSVKTRYVVPLKLKISN